MGKQVDKRIELARAILDTTDPDRLQAVELALTSPGVVRFTKAEIAELEAQLDRIERGEERTRSWAEVKKKALGKVRR